MRRGLFNFHTRMKIWQVFDGHLDLQLEEEEEEEEERLGQEWEDDDKDGCAGMYAPSYSLSMLHIHVKHRSILLLTAFPAEDY
jgi:hypothetical protein